MRVIRSGDGRSPEWSELDDFEIIRVPAEERILIPRRGKREIYVVADGRPICTCGEFQAKVGEDGCVHLPPSRASATEIWAWHGDALVVRIIGHWEAMAVAGVSTLRTVDDPPLAGRPYDIQKTCHLDRHYHDYQEHWIVIEGEGRLAVGEEFVDVEPGDCVSTAVGWHHDCVFVKGGGSMRIAWFGSTPRRKKRVEHLHEDADGVAVPEVPLPCAMLMKGVTACL